MTSNAEAPDLHAPLTRVLSGCVPGFKALLACNRLSGGASQETYRLQLDTDRGAMALALRRAAGGATAEATPEHPGLAVEAALMQAAAAAGVPEPEVLHVLAPEDDLGPGFIMAWLDGETLGARITRSPDLAEARKGLARACGETLARIHAINLDSTGLRGHLATISPREHVEQTWQRYQALGSPQPVIDYTARWLLDHLPDNPAEALVHNDFRNGNLLVDNTGIRAVLDWELAHIGDPMRDLGWICTNSWRFGRSDLPVGGFGTREDLFAGYEAASGTPVDPDHVRFWEVFGSFWWAVGCLGMAEHWRSGPDPTVERPAIGRRSSECQVDCANLLLPGPVVLVTPVDPARANARGTADELPRRDELLASVRDFLRDEVMPATEGRLNFMGRVAANSLDIALRDLAAGPLARRQEATRLQTLLGSTDSNLSTLRWHLVNGLRDGSIALDHPGLGDHLRTTACNQLAIDQPRYSGLATALAWEAP